MLATAPPCTHIGRFGSLQESLRRMSDGGLSAAQTRGLPLYLDDAAAARCRAFDRSHRRKALMRSFIQKT